MPDLREQLHSSLHGRVCFMGLGNVQGGDDGFGVRLAKALIRAGLPHVLIAGTEPEPLVRRCVDSGFDNLVFLDAVDVGAVPGSVVFLDSEEMASWFPQISTHSLSLGLLAKCVENGRSSRAWLLGAQPASLKPSTVLSPAIQATLAILTAVIGSVVSEEAAI